MEINSETLNQHYYDDNELFEQINRINALLGSENEFETTIAKKEYSDIFGVKILFGETYYKRQIDQGYGDIIRLSRATMERLLYAFFANNQQLTNLADKLYQNEIQELLNKLNE